MTDQLPTKYDGKTSQKNFKNGFEFLYVRNLGFLVDITWHDDAILSILQYNSETTYG